jgi:DNA repair exonuclease SbcCD ATPase subunit
MYLLELTFYEFRQFLQIVLFISVPLIVICLAVTTFLHYRRKKMKTRHELPVPETEYGLTLPNSVQPLMRFQGKTEDNNTLVKQYEQQLRQSREKYHSLERSFRKLQESYSQVISRETDAEESNETEKSELNVMQEKIEAYEQKMAQLQHALEYMENNSSNETAAINREAAEHKEKELEHAEGIITTLKEDLSRHTNENDRLRLELLNNINPTDAEQHYEERLQQLKDMLSSAEEEILTLKNNFSDLGYLEDLVKEKNLQIEFLQHQLDQRIKHNHRLEHQQNAANDLNNQLQQAIEQAKAGAHNLEENLQAKQRDLAAVQAQLDEQADKNEQLQQAIQLKTYETAQFTNQLSELRSENANLHESVADTTHRFILLQEELATAQLCAKEYEEKWEQNSRLISRIYREIAGSIENEMSVSGTGAIMDARKEQEHTESLV